MARSDDEPVGTVAIRAAWDAAPHVTTPWIGGLFVIPTRRHAGLGMRLVEAAVAHAAALGHPTVHAAVTVAADRYLARGWLPAGTAVAGDATVTLLSRDA